MDCAEIGKRIAALRDKKGITQSELARAMFVRREVVTHWEIGDRDLKTEYTIKLADYFGVTCDYILRGIPAENIDIVRETGLDNQSIESIKTIAKQMDRGPAPFTFADSLNAFIGSKRFLSFILYFWDYMCKYKEFSDELESFAFRWETKKNPLAHAAECSLDYTNEAYYHAKSVMELKEKRDFACFKLEQALNRIISNFEKEAELNGKA